MIRFGLSASGSRAAIARRDKWRGSVPPRLDSRKTHLLAPATREAQRAVAEVFAGRGVPLGQGNFGAAFRVVVDGVPKVVKLGSRRTVHTREPSDLYAWVTQKWGQGGRGLKAAAREMLHEAGVANELWALGHRVVPETVYVEYKGRPAVVREYGTIPADVTAKEVDALSLALDRVIEDGFAVRDDLLVARRPDGSLFIADVGFWAPYRKGKEDTIFSGGASDARHSLDWDLGAFVKTLPWAHGQRVPTLFHLKQARARLAYVTRDRPDKPNRQGTAFYKHSVKQEVDAIRALLDQRTAAGLRS